jgi:hypothetical protein
MEIDPDRPIVEFMPIHRLSRIHRHPGKLAPNRALELPRERVARASVTLAAL